MNARFDPLALHLDAAAEVERIATTLRSQVLKQLRRRGIVLGLSGGVDSSVVAALCVRAFGPANVFGIFMPDAFRVAFGVPDAYTPIGALAIGWPQPDEPSPSLRRGRRPPHDVIHRGRW